MRRKQLLSLMLLSLSVVLMIYSVHQMGYLPSKQYGPQPITNSPLSPTERFPQNEPIPVGKSKNGPLLFIVGAVLFCIGCGAGIYYRERVR